MSFLCGTQSTDVSLCCCAATLVHVVGYAAIVTMRKQLSSTLRISVDYLSELSENEDCEVAGTVSHMGRSTATATVELRVRRTGRLAARGTHVVLFSHEKLPDVTSKM